MNSGQSETGSFPRQVGLVVGGAGGSQVILALSAPLLTRIYSLEAFALAAIFMAVTSVLAVGAAGRFEFALMLPKRRDDAVDIAVAGLAILSAVTVLLLVGSVGILLAVDAGAAWFQTPFLLALPAGLAVTSMWNLQTKWLSRESRFADIGRGELAYAAATVLSQILIALTFASPESGLIVGHLIGRTLSEVYIGVRILRQSAFSRPSWQRSWVGATRYRRFPLLSLPAGFLTTGVQYLPTLMLAPFGPEILGAFALANRVITTPLSFIGNAVAHVFFPRISRAREVLTNARSLLLTTYLALLALIAPIAAAIMFGGPVMFATIFGEEWRLAGRIAVMLTPLMIVRFVVAPPSLMMQAFERQGIMLVWTVGFAVATASGFGIGLALDDWEVAIHAYTWLASLAYAVFLCLTFWVVSERGSGKRGVSPRREELRDALKRCGEPLRRVIHRLGLSRVAGPLIRIRYPRGVRATVQSVSFQVACSTLADYRAVKRFPVHEAPFADRYVAYAKRARTIVDVGANIGLYALAAATANPQAKVYAFEPENSARRCLARGRRINDRGNLQVYDFAIGGEDDKELQLTKKGRSGHFVSRAPQGVESASIIRRGAQAIRARSLASMIEEGVLPEPELIKVDVEGYEGGVLRGLVQALRTARPVIFVEVHPRLLKRYGDSVDELSKILGQVEYVGETVRTGSDEDGEHSQMHVIYWPAERYEGDVKRLPAGKRCGQ